MKFSQEIDVYHILTIDLNDYIPSNKNLPNGLTIIHKYLNESLRTQEKKLLIRIFDDWQIPFNGKLIGFREDSPIFVIKDTQLIGGVYLCDKNEFDDKEDFGQLHYAFIDPSYQGLGIYSVVFSEVISKAKSWKLKSLYLNSDRHILPEIYIRWGAKRIRTLPKKSRLNKLKNHFVLNEIYYTLKSIRRKLLNMIIKDI
jgi:GNAT superfamily N-acetyltransferase